MKVRWGVLGVAGIATKKVVPAMQLGQHSEIVAIASRDLARAQSAARDLGIPKAYGSYEALLADPEIEAVYNPLPNHLHVPWSIRAADAGKHVLCEKPIAMSVAEALELVRARDRTGVKIGEAFMVRTHPQWLRARELVVSGRIGQLRAISGFFSYYNDDPANIRNKVELGGGALMDVGCYPIFCSRFLFGEEPVRALGSIDRDPAFGTDRLTSAVLEFPSGHAIFTSSTQIAKYQRMLLVGTQGRIEIEIPFNAPNDRPTRILIDDTYEEFPICDQYTIQGDLFSQAIREGGEVAVPLEESVKTMTVIESIRL
ncbi:MAG: Gfo/Idh/MocA family oxidoreductase [Acidobacteriota bacterium]|nr:Gfo/Idh/MocA family oxidoreductase [Acidobacteriota bacterium]